MQPKQFRKVTDVLSSNPQIVEVTWDNKIMMIGHYTATIITLSEWRPYFRMKHWESLKSFHLAILIYKILDTNFQKEIDKIK